MIRVLIADDSAFMRMVLSDLFKSQDDFEVIETARNGKDAIEKILKYKPDLVTMDINMPMMDGIQALEVIMRDCPLPVVMISSLTKEGADATIRALELGAVDFVAKPDGSISNIDAIQNEILTKCRAAATATVTSSAQKPGGAILHAPQPPKMRRIALPLRGGGERADVGIPTRARFIPKMIPLSGFSKAGNKIVLIGTSTGGPKALQAVISGLPKGFPCGVLVVQHMPPGFTKSLAERLDEISQICVKEAENHDIIEGGHVYIAPGNYHMTVVSSPNGREIVLNQDPPLGTLRPAADVLFKSAVPFGQEIVSVILTGMGQDGAEGMKEIKRSGGYIIAEEESTCVVYGMPKAVIDQGIADEALPLPEIAPAIVKAVHR